jgi:hypothetical protein
MRVELVRSGGFAGLVMKASMDTDEFPTEIATKVAAAIDALDWDAEQTPSGWADGFQYQLTVRRDGQLRTKILQEGELPPDARPLLVALLSRAQLG